MKKAKETVCNANCMQIERMYEAHLELENIERTDMVPEQFLQEYGKKFEDFKPSDRKGFRG